VIAHLTPVAAAVQNVYGLPPAWLDKVRVELRRFWLTWRLRAAHDIHGNDAIAFTSKIQWFKRPDVFINGVVALCARPRTIAFSDAADARDR